MSKAKQGLAKDLEEILKDIKHKTEVANTPVEREPIGTYSARQGSQRRAKLDLEDLRLEYVTLAGETAVPIVIVGQDVEAAAALIAEVNPDSPPISATLVTDEISAQIEDLYIGQNTRKLVTPINTFLEAAGRRAGVTSMPMVVYQTSMQGVVTSRADLEDRVLAIVSEHVGSEINYYGARARALENAVANGFASSVLPIFLKVSKQSDLETVIQGIENAKATPYILATPGTQLQGAVTLDALDSESVVKALKKINQEIKKANKHKESA